MPSGHRFLDNGLLHGPAVLGNRRGTKPVEIEPALQLLPCVLALPAPVACRIRAGGIPEAAYQLPGLRELMAHPGRHHGVAAGHGQPGQRVGQRPAKPLCVPPNAVRTGCAGNILEPLPNRRFRFPRRRPASLPNPGKDLVQRTVDACGFGRAQPVPRGKQVRRGLGQSQSLVVEDVQRKPGIQFRVVYPALPQSAVLIVFDEAVIGIARKSERIQA